MLVLYLLLIALVGAYEYAEKPKRDHKSPRVQDQSPCECRSIYFRVFRVPVCPANSHWVFCFTCEGTCANPNPPCPRRCQRPRCVCDAGFVRSGGQCIRRAMCPQMCPANEAFRTCATACEPTCANRNPTCTLQCLSPRCQCIIGVVRHNGQCIRPQFCPVVDPPICPANQQWVTCSTVCEPSCQNVNPTCQSFACGPPKCQCRPGFYRRSSAPNAPCVPWQQCWQWGGPRTPPRPWGPRPRGGRPWDWWFGAGGK